MIRVKFKDAGRTNSTAKIAIKARSSDKLDGDPTDAIGTPKMMVLAITGRTSHETYHTNIKYEPTTERRKLRLDKELNPPTNP
ncbi:MAG: hypothetical protein QW146_00020 [Candidatus Bathyarchaeia archaeon]